MTLRIDQAGRVVLPKPIRDRFDLTAGTDLEVEERSDGVVLRPVRQRPSLVNRDGLPVHCGKLPEGYDWRRLIDDDREDRMRGNEGR